MNELWFQLGFTCDDVFGAWQHWRLATECAQALVGDEAALIEGIRETAGDGEFALYWFVSPAAAHALDAHGVGWRRFVIRTAPVPVQWAPALGP